MSETRPWSEGRQTVLNARPIPISFTNAPSPIRVHARILWEKDGEEWVTGQAVAWTRTRVLVHFASYGRLVTNGVWVDAGDIRRV